MKKITKYWRDHVKKLQCLLLAVLMLASLSAGLSITAFADQNSGKLSGTLSWNYDEATKTLSITLTEQTTRQTW